MHSFGLGLRQEAIRFQQSAAYCSYRQFELTIETLRGPLESTGPALDLFYTSCPLHTSDLLINRSRIPRRMVRDVDIRGVAPMPVLPSYTPAQARLALKDAQFGSMPLVVASERMFSEKEQDRRLNLASLDALALNATRVRVLATHGDYNPNGLHDAYRPVDNIQFELWDFYNMLAKQGHVVNKCHMRAEVNGSHAGWMGVTEEPCEVIADRSYAIAPAELAKELWDFVVWCQARPEMSIEYPDFTLSNEERRFTSHWPEPRPRPSRVA